jgi:hypothetical protein
METVVMLNEQDNKIINRLFTKLLIEHRKDLIQKRPSLITSEEAEYIKKKVNLDDLYNKRY